VTAPPADEAPPRRLGPGEHGDTVPRPSAVTKTHAIEPILGKVAGEGRAQGLRIARLARVVMT